MAFTLAHPAAALPFSRLLGKLGVRSALVIGSMVPDFWYVVPLAGRNTSHMPHGLITYCLPVGLLVYWLYHAGIKRPLVAMLPAALGARLEPVAMAGFPRASWLAVLVSLLVGAATHQAWDTFVHSHGTGVSLVPPLQAALLAIVPAELRVFHVLQALSSALGLYLIARWSLRWLESATPPAMPPTAAPVDATRTALLVTLLTLIAAGCAVAGAVETVQSAVGGFSSLAGALARSVLGAFIVSLLALSAAWHLGQLRSATQRRSATRDKSIC
jgi:hypothetical protein